MTIRSWIVRRLEEEGAYDMQLVGGHGLAVERRNLPDAYVYCVEPAQGAAFTSEDLAAACEELPELEFAVLVKRAASNDTYELAEDLGVCVGGLNELKSALARDYRISRHRTREQAYLLSRLEPNRHVKEIRRRGAAAYEIARVGRLADLTIVTIEHYELTSDSVYELIAAHEELVVDAIVTTNPNCRGFAQDALRAGRQTNTQILTLHQLLDSLGD